MSIFNSKYQALRIWGQDMGSSANHIENEQAVAEASNAPLDAIFRRDGVWLTLTDMPNKNKQRGIMFKLLEYYAYHETPEKRAAWQADKPSVIIIKKTAT